MIRFGPSGIPLSCKGRTLKDGIEDVHNLGLTALEIQLLRINTVERYPMEDELNKNALNSDNDIIVEIIKDNGEGEALSGKELKKRIGKTDLLRTMVSGIAKNYPQLRAIGQIAKDLDVQLSIHTPYYMHLTEDKDHPITIQNIEAIKWAGILADQLNAENVVTHMGLYGKTKKGSLENLRKNLRHLSTWYKNNKLNVNIGLETNGKQEVFGTLEEVLAAAKGIPRVIPVLNFPHIHARTGGSLKEKEDFDALFQMVKKATRLKTYYTHFSGVEYEGKNEKRYTPIKKGDLRFEPLAESIIDNNLDITLISSSPLMEHDAMYMKVILERVLTRNESKRIKKEKK